ncbi:glycosyltransferase family 2 protein, partial [Enterococcus faecalis]
DVLDRLLDRIKIDKNIAVVSPKVLNEDGTTQYLVRQKLDVFDYLLRFIPFQFVKKIFDKRLCIYECRDLSDTETTD